MNLDIITFGGSAGVVIAIICIGVWVGKITERVGNNRFDIEKGYQENRQDHKEIIRLIKNGGK